MLLLLLLLVGERRLLTEPRNFCYRSGRSKVFIRSVRLLVLVMCYA